MSRRLVRQPEVAGSGRFRVLRVIAITSRRLARRRDQTRQQRAQNDRTQKIRTQKER